MSQNTCRDASKHGTGAAGEQQQGQVDHVNPKRNPNCFMHGREKNYLKKKEMTNAFTASMKKNIQKKRTLT